MDKYLDIEIVVYAKATPVMILLLAECQWLKKPNSLMEFFMEVPPAS